MRRSVLVFAVVISATFIVAPDAGAVGPGGWSHVGVGATSSTPSLDGHVYALNSQNPGVLYAGGDFTTAGGNPKAKRIARWNGSTWSALGNTPLTNGAVFAIAYHAGKVYVGGTFQNAGGHSRTPTSSRSGTARPGRRSATRRNRARPSTARSMRCRSSGTRCMSAGRTRTVRASTRPTTCWPAT